jgi:peroxiredoxin Q/BCP
MATKKRAASRSKARAAKSRNPAAQALSTRATQTSRSSKPATAKKATAKKATAKEATAKPATAKRATAKKATATAKEPLQPPSGGKATADVGTRIVDFRLVDQHGAPLTNEDLAGQPYVLYFYPKDDTPGCTTEACNFRDSAFAYKALGADIVGISVDDVGSHKEFEKKYELPFTLLADPTGETCAEYGVLRDYKMTQIAARQSFIIDPDGNIAKYYADVDPEIHSAQVLADLELLIPD